MRLRTVRTRRALTGSPGSAPASGSRRARQSSHPRGGGGVPVPSQSLEVSEGERTPPAPRFRRARLDFARPSGRPGERRRNSRDPEGRGDGRGRDARGRPHASAPLRPAASPGPPRTPHPSGPEAPWPRPPSTASRSGFCCARSSGAGAPFRHATATASGGWARSSAGRSPSAPTEPPGKPSRPSVAGSRRSGPPARSSAARALAAEIRRRRVLRPVNAVRPSAGERLTTWARRRPVASSVDVSLVGAALVEAVVTMTRVAAT